MFGIRFYNNEKIILPNICSVCGKEAKGHLKLKQRTHQDFSIEFYGLPIVGLSETVSTLGYSLPYCTRHYFKIITLRIIRSLIPVSILITLILMIIFGIIDQPKQLRTSASLLGALGILGIPLFFILRLIENKTASFKFSRIQDGLLIEVPSETFINGITINDANENPINLEDRYRKR